MCNITMGNIPSSFTLFDGDDKHDKIVLDTYKNWVDCLLYNESDSDESIFRILNSICITDHNLIKKHILNIKTKIKTPCDFVASKAINILTSRERLIYLKPWRYYKIRESNVDDTFILSDLDEIENIASDDCHIFWTILRVVNNVDIENLTLEFEHIDLWIKICILLGHIDLANMICRNFNRDLASFERFRTMYSPIDSQLVSNLKDTE